MKEKVFRRSLGLTAGTPFLQLLHRPATRPIETRNASLSLEITLQEKESQDAVLECAFRRPGSLSCNVILSEAFTAALHWNLNVTFAWALAKARD